MPLSTGYYGELRAFAEVARQGSFAAAARVLRVTPSALSQAVRALEQRVNVALLHRTTRSMSLTDAGQRLLREIAPAIEHLDGALAQVQAVAQHPTGTVRIISPRWAFRERIEARLPPLMRRYPDLVVDITVNDSITDIAAQGYDLGVRLGEFLDPETVAVSLGGSLRQVAVASPSYIEAYGAPRHPHDLRHHRCLNWRPDDRVHPYQWEFGKEGQFITLPVLGPLIVNDRVATLTAALAGSGIALSIEESVASHLEAGRLVTVLDDWALSFAGFYLFYHRHRLLSPAVRAVLDALRST